MKHRFLIEWLLIALLLPPAMVWFDHQPGLIQADLALYDKLLSFDVHEPSANILLIAIDNRSMLELGDWPWPRRLHAQLLERLSKYSPQAVLLDLFLDEPAPDPEDDKQLTIAMQQLPVFLPLRYLEPNSVTTSPPQFIAPQPIFAKNIKGTGHVDITPDVDGIARRFFRWEGPPKQLHPYIGWIIASLSHPPSLTKKTMPEENGWQRQTPFGFALAGPAGTYRTVPYSSVLRGEVPAELLRGKILLIGAVASSGLNDEVPVAGIGPQMHMSGIELNANAIDVLSQDRAIIFPHNWQIFTWITLPIWIVLVLFLRIPRNALAITFGAAVGLIALSTANLVWNHVWLPPIAPLLGVSIAYFLWSWRRLNALLMFFQDRVSALNAIPAGAFEPVLHVDSPKLDTVENQTQALDRAIDRLSQMQALLSEGLWQMPVAVLICHDDGKITQSNAAAQILISPAQIPSELTDDPLSGHSLPQLLQDITETHQKNLEVPNAAVHWSRSLKGEYTTRHGGVFRLRAARLDDSKATSPAWLVVLQDLTVERLTQRKREQWLRFVSHDLRSPQVSIISLLDLYEQPRSGVNTQRLVHDVRREAQRTLRLAESFMDMDAAESNNYRFIEMQAGTIVLDAIDQAWPYAKVRDISLIPSLSDNDCLVRVDPVMLTRALLNILNNAIRHTPPGGTVNLCVDIDNETTEIIVAIRDEGEGIEPQKLGQLILNRSILHDTVSDDTRQPVRNRGLGLAVVHTVIKRHHGWLDAYSAPGAGTTFLIGLPSRENE
ncbi:CHASE2 domain-containing protein [Collimonas sp. NPDC087041]|uniref:CHASE2 domain-containing protein n=1 Tax=Collimonas sp. NPDC087041 TaxID=3363960 RepID=UPI00382C7E4B